MPARPPKSTSKSSCKSAHYTRRDGTIDSLHLRAAGRTPRFPLMNQLSAGQVRQFQSLAGVYRADLLDPAAWEALLLLLEICNILDLLPSVVTCIFGPGMRERLETWSGEIPPRFRPGEVRRAWVWLPNETRPHVYPITTDGTIILCDYGPAAAEGIELPCATSHSAKAKQRR